MGKGRKGSDTGSTLEGIVEQTLSRYGFQAISYSKYAKRPQDYGEELLLKNVPYTSIYSHTARTEFLLRSKRFKLEIRIECKWQQVTGSVDEKLPYLYLNAIEAMPESQIIIIIDGEGWKRGAKEWLERVVKDKQYQPENSNKEIQVMKLTEFITWVNNTFSSSP